MKLEDVISKGKNAISSVEAFLLAIYFGAGGVTVHDAAFHMIESGCNVLRWPPHGAWIGMIVMMVIFLIALLR